MIDKNPADAVRQATGHGEFEALARAGHVVSGLLHLLIAYIVVRLAFGDPGNADQSGALGLFASSTGGRLALWAAVVAFVIIKSRYLKQHPVDGLGDELRKWVGEQIGPIARPRDVYIVGELPKTRSGKIMRRLLRDVAEGREVGDTTTLADTAVMSVISAQVK